MVSEYSLNSMLLTAVDLQVIKYENSDQSSESIDAIINGFEKAFGTHSNVTLMAEASITNLDKYKPRIVINPDSSVIEFYLDLHIRNPLEPSIDAALMITKAVTKAFFKVNDNFLLWGTIEDLQLSVIEYRPYFKTMTTMDMINSKIKILLPAIEAYANNKLDDGYRLPLSRNITKYIKKQKVEPKQGYLLIDGDADFSVI